MFKDLIDKIKTFEWEDINGKVLKMITVKDGDYRMIAGQDIDTGEVYIISDKQSK